MIILAIVLSFSAMAEDQKLDSLLSFKEWKEERDKKDEVSDWQKIIRERNHREMVGRIYQCVGQCRVDRGNGFFKGSYRSNLYEGDEIQTIGESYAWIFLFDGTMMRLSPKSSLTINELNIGVKENFINARINAGNVLWLSRHEETFQEVDVRETDITFFPYSEYESLPHGGEKSYIDHYKRLNEKILSNNKMTKNKLTYAFIVTANATLMGFSPDVEIITLIGGQTFFNRRSKEMLGLQDLKKVPVDLFLQLRGFNNKELVSIQEDLWFEIDEKGRSYQVASDSKWFNVGAFITRRIPSIMHGREIFLKRYSEFSFREKYDPALLEKKDGYRLWGKMHLNKEEEKSDLDMRLQYLKEYFRRVETSNLLATKKFTERLIKREEKNITTTYGNYFFINALNKYYKFIEKKEISDLNSTDKFLWKKMHGIR